MTTGLFSPTHIVLLGLVALLVFGPKRLPEIGRSLGHGLRGFKESVSGEQQESGLEGPAGGRVEVPQATANPLPVAQASAPPLAEPGAHTKPREQRGG
jgi:sec-independent protein translocase protein TatA